MKDGVDLRSQIHQPIFEPSAILKILVRRRGLPSIVGKRIVHVWQHFLACHARADVIFPMMLGSVFFANIVKKCFMATVLLTEIKAVDSEVADSAG